MPAARPSSGAAKKTDVPAVPTAVRQSTRSSVWQWMSRLMPAVPSPFALPQHLPQLAATVIRRAEAFVGGNGGVAGILLAAFIGLMALTAAAVGALRHDGLRHMRWRAMLRRHHIVAQSWSTPLEEVSQSGARAPAIAHQAPVETLKVPRRESAPDARKHQAA